MAPSIPSLWHPRCWPQRQEISPTHSSFIDWRVLMPRLKSVLSTTASLVLSLPCACAFGLFLPESAGAQSSGDPVIYLDQGWSQADREMYYQISQGTQVMAYDIFLNLEVAGSQELFRSGAN